MLVRGSSFQRHDYKIKVRYWQILTIDIRARYFENPWHTQFIPLFILRFECTRQTALLRHLQRLETPGRNMLRNVSEYSTHAFRTECVFRARNAFFSEFPPTRLDNREATDCILHCIFTLERICTAIFSAEPGESLRTLKRARNRQTRLIHEEWTNEGRGRGPPVARSCYTCSTGSERNVT